MKKIFLIRHASAEPRENREEDFSRALVEKGKEEAFRAGCLMNNLGIKPELAVISSARRVKQTLEFIFKGYGGTIKTTEYKRLFYDSDRDYLDIIREQSNTVDAILLVGHNPAMRDLANFLMNGYVVNLSFPKASLYAFEVNCETWEGLAGDVSSLKLFLRRQDIEKIISLERVSSVKTRIRKYIMNAEQYISDIMKGEISLKGIHKLRVVHRRMQIIHERILASDENLLTDRISNIIGITGKYRDLCVQHKILKKQTGQNTVEEKWKKRKKKSKKKTLKRLQELFRYQTVEPYTVLEKEMKSLGDDVDVQAKTLRQIETSISELKAPLDATKQRDEEALHEFRGQLKKIRYLAEFYFSIIYDIAQRDTIEHKIMTFKELHDHLDVLHHYAKIKRAVEKQSEQFDKKDRERVLKTFDEKIDEEWLYLDENLEERVDQLKTMV